ncbi:MAG: Twin-arginine translocation pathway signal [Nitratiruptor sp.]|nr:Twin-arginine translocation pathway signal [Nitratiruptor sp.]NPA83864.1 DUF882 domain-containing protein [Campylobacterota bacterium]
MDRRTFIKNSFLLGASIIIPSRSAAAKYEKRLRLYHTHTGEWFNGVFWADGEYIYETLEDLEYFLRDYRNNEVHKIDLRLIEYLHSIRQRLETSKEFLIYSAYRSPQTNAYLRRHSRGVAKNSFHLYGRAVDVRLAGYDLGVLRFVALALRKGGVGYYPRSGFVHLDTGTPRYWRYPS